MSIEELCKHFRVAEHLIPDVAALHEELVPAVTRKFEWSLGRMSWYNMYCYRGYNTLDWNQVEKGVRTAHILSAPNKSGKSALIDLLSLAIYGKSVRGAVKDIVNKGQKSGWVAITLTVKPPTTPEETWRIERRFTRSTQKAVFKVNGVVKPVSAKVLTKILNTQLGSFDEFMETRVRKQFSKNLSEMTPAAALKCFNKVCGTELLQNAYAAARGAQETRRTTERIAHGR